MPASNYLTDYVYQERVWAKNSLIFARDSDQDNIADHIEHLHNMNPHIADPDPNSRIEASMIREFIPGYFGKRPWVIDSPTTESKKP